MSRALLAVVLALPACAPPASTPPPTTIQYVMVERAAPEPDQRSREPGAPATRPASPPEPRSFDQSTPRTALWSLVHAFEKGRWDEVLRLAPDDSKANDALTAKRLQEAWEGPQAGEIQRRIRAVRQALGTAELERDGDRAALPYALGTVQLVREHGEWKVRDF
jgi:hypothetical protein